MEASVKGNRLAIILLSLVALVSVFCGLYVVKVGILLPVAIIAVAALIAIQTTISQNQKAIVWLILTYAFMMNFFDREVGHFQWGVLQEGILVLGMITLIFTASKHNWKAVFNDFAILVFFWFIVSVYEVFNPAGADIQGWIQEVRSAALYPFLITCVGFVLLKTNKDLNTFLKMVLILSMLATINGIKQLYIGPSPGEQRFLDEGGNITHILWGKLRVFSFYSDAGQFGASQAHIALMAIVLALGPFKFWKKMVMLGIGALTFYGMLISGTRGALVGLVVGAFVALLLSKNFKALMWGGIVLGGFLGGLKYTTVGNNVYAIFRLRSALDPQEASFNVRLVNQAKLREYLETRPFGGGLGTMGDAGLKFNKGSFLATIPPDSFWVKVWGMYGIVGFVVWICIMTYILGTCCGIVWRIKDPGLKVKMIALTSGFAGILFCSYGNEVINTVPSSFIVYLSWVLIYISPKIEKEINERNQTLNQQNAI